MAERLIRVCDRCDAVPAMDFSAEAAGESLHLDLCEQCYRDVRSGRDSRGRQSRRYHRFRVREAAEDVT